MAQKYYSGRPDGWPAGWPGAGGIGNKTNSAPNWVGVRVGAELGNIIEPNFCFSKLFPLFVVQLYKTVCFADLAS